MAAPAVDLKKPVTAPPTPPPATLTKMNATKDPFRNVQLQGHVGFDSLPHQLERKAVDHGFQFNLLCVGETGIGKTTLIESLFNMKLEFEPCSHELKTVALKTKTFDIEEGRARLKLTIVETAGFGDQLDKEKSVKIIMDYINEQYEKYLKEELKISRHLQVYTDSRVHACLYFISPTGHGLKALDVATLRQLSKRVNVIPVVAKADTSCKDELMRFKAKVLAELKAQNIPVYNFPTDDDTLRSVNAQLNTLIPYAVVGSTDFMKKDDGNVVRARRYPWGVVEVENEAHCDFVKLREALLRTNVDALCQRTHGVLYESYRRERLKEMGVNDGDTGPKMSEAFEVKSKSLLAEMSRREQEMRENFVSRVTKKEEELKRQEEAVELKRKHMEEEFSMEMTRLEREIQQTREEKMRLETKFNELKAGKKKK